jgi:hypothetical protein
MDKQLKYPVGCKILWCGEEFEVLKNYGDSDRSGMVKQGDDIIDNFYFSYQGDEAVLISK